MIESQFNIYVSSDLHIGHDNISRYCHRPFASTEEMNAKLVRNSNQVVRPKDILIILGDWIWTGGSSELIKSTIAKFNGRKILVKGNHDRKSNSFYMTNGVDFICDRFVWELAGKRILFIHDPYNVSNEELSKYDIILHGHCHNNKPLFRKYKGRIFINVSVENIKYQPMNLHSLINKALLEIKNNQGLSHVDLLDNFLYRLLHWRKS